MQELEERKLDLLVADLSVWYNVQICSMLENFYLLRLDMSSGPKTHISFEIGVWRNT